MERLTHARENESAWVYALAFAKRSEQAAAALLAHCEGAEGVRAQAALVELVKASDSTRAAAAAERLVELDATRARYWRRRAEGLGNGT